MVFIPFGQGKVTNDSWDGVIEITPALSFREASYLANYLMTWHFAYPEKDLDGLYGIHNDKDKELVSTERGASFTVNKEKQEHVPSLICPLVLGSTSWDKKNVINAIGIKTQIKGLQYAGSWVLFLIEHFFKENAYAKHLFYDTFGNFQNHVCNGSMVYLDESRGNACIEILVKDNKVKTRGIKKKYMAKVNNGFYEEEHPIFLRTVDDSSAIKDLKIIGGTLPPRKELLEQDKKITIKELHKNVDIEKAIYTVREASIHISEKLKIEYEQYYMENSIPALDIQNVKITKF